MFGLCRLTCLIAQRSIPRSLGRVEIGPLMLSSRIKSSDTNSVVSSDRSQTLPSTNVAKKAKQAVKDVGYSAVILGGVALTGVILYVIFRELFSKKSPNGVYNAAFKICKDDPQVQNLLGSSIKAHGETNSRGRRRHTAHHTWYDNDGRLHMAMKFYLCGNMASGVVHLEVVENESGEFDYRYLVMETEGGFSRRQIVLRSQSTSPNLPATF